MHTVVHARHRTARVALAAIAVFVASALGIFTIGLTRTAANPQSGFVALSTGDLHICAITTDGGLKCWGLTELPGYPNNGITSVPVDVTGLTSGVASVNAGLDETCAVTTVGGATCWPVAVTGLASGVAAVAVGSEQRCALTTSGGVECWGGNEKGQLGDGTQVSRATPAGVVGLSSGVVAIAAGGEHTCALTNGGGVKCWGNNSVGELGTGTLISSSIPVDVSGLGSGVASITVGSGHTCALMSGGAAKCWGTNFAGQLGDGTLALRETPTAVLGLGSGVAAISAGASDTCALLTGGSLRCWGTNFFGQLGDGTLIDRAAPVAVAGLSGSVTQVSAGGSHTCALMADSTIQCWGYDLYGQLGDGRLLFQNNAPFPAITSPLTVVVSIQKPTPTSTPCPTNGCATATATSTVAPTPQPGTGINLSMGIDVNGDKHDDCDTRGGAASCTIGLGSTFVLKTYLDGLPQQLPLYGGVESKIQYSGVAVIPNSANSNAWPKCSLPVSFYGDHFVAFGCAGNPSNFIGQVGEASFNCLATGDVTMAHGDGTTEVVAPPPSYATYFEPGIGETLHISCVVLPTPTPTPTPRPVGGLSQDVRLDPSRGGTSWPMTYGVALLGAIALFFGGLMFAGKRARRSH